MAGGLWRHRDFLRLWFGQSVSQLGSRITFLALPLAAVISLDASPFQMGVLMALGGLPSLVIGPFVGAYLDRHRRRPLLIAVDWARAALLLSIPAAYLLGYLHIVILFIVAFGMGVLGLVFDVGYRSYLPSLIGREHLVEGNSKLELSRSGAEVAGPGIGGAIVQLVGAPIALIADAVSFAVSALSLHMIRAPEPVPEPNKAGRSLPRDAVEGLRWVWRHPVLRPLAIAAAVGGFFNAAFEAVYLLYLNNQLGLSPALIGTIAAFGGVGMITGALLARRVTARIGIGRSTIFGLLLLGVADAALPLATGPLPAIVVILVAGQAGFGLGLTLFNVSQTSLRQAVTDATMQGRMNATFRLALAGSIPFGALAGGLMGQTVGLRPTLFIAVLGEVSAGMLLLMSPLFSVRFATAGAGVPKQTARPNE